MNKIINEYTNTLLNINEQYDIELTNYLKILFRENTSKNIIFSILNKFGKNNLFDVLERKTIAPANDRYNHTLSAFLLGLIVRDNLHIDMRSLPKIISESHKENFFYFWMLICLYHDCAYDIENNDSAKDCKTITDFVREYGVTYNFIEKSEYKELFINYYFYRTNDMKVIDHGIAGAILFYDTFMSFYEECRKSTHTSKGKSFTCKKGDKLLHFSADFPKHMLLVANTIARHNIFSAGIGDEEKYRNYHLDDLIPTSNCFSKVCLYDKLSDAKNKILFMLEFIDTIDPIKILSKSDNNQKSWIYMMNDVEIGFNYAKQQMYLKYPDNLVNVYSKDINNWLGVMLNINQNVYTFEIERKSERQIA